MAEQEDPKEKPVIVSGSSESSGLRLKMRGRKIYWLAGLVLLCIIAGFWFFSTRDGNKNNNIPSRENNQAVIPTDKQVPDDYSSMTETEAQATLLKDTGLNLKQLESQTFTDDTFKSFPNAYEAAQALSRAGSYQKSYDAYVIADKTGANGSKDYQFYLNYAAAADYVSKPDVAVRMMSKAKEVVSADKSIAAGDKQDIINNINQKLHLR